MASLLLGLLLLPLASGVYQPFPKSVDRAIAICNEFDQDLCEAVPACSFCRSVYGEAHCFATAVTPNLPDELYPCRYLVGNGPSNACEGKAEAECKASSCSWCVSAAVGSACYTPEDAKRLPSAIFTCTNPSVRAPQPSGPPHSTPTPTAGHLTMGGYTPARDQATAG